MKFGTTVSPHRYLFLLAGIGVVIIAASTYVVYTLNAQRATITALEADRAALLLDTASSTTAASSTIFALQTELTALKDKYGILNDD